MIRSNWFIGPNVQSAGVSGDLTFSYLLRDSFVTPLSPGEVDGTLSEPGPGVRKVTDTENKLSIVDGRVVIPSVKTVPSPGDPALWLNSVARVPGRATLATITLPHANGYSYFGHDSDQETWGANVFSFGSNIYIYDDGSSGTYVVGYTGLTPYQCAIVNQEVGNLYLIKGGAVPEWKLLWRSVLSATTPYYPTVIGYTGGISVDNLRVTDLPAPWNRTYGLATDRIAGLVPTGSSFVHEPDCSIEWIQTALPTPTNSSWIQFRIQDVNNFWLASVNDTGWFQLWQMIDASPVYRTGTGENAVSAGDRIVVIADGSSISGYVDNTLVWSYGSVDFADRTNGLTAWEASFSDLITWPVKLSGAALFEISGV